MGYGDCASENAVSSRQTDASLHQLAWVVFGCSQCSQQIVKSYGSDWESPRMMFMSSCCCESIYYVKAVRIWNVLCSLKDKHGIFTIWFVESRTYLQCSLLCVGSCHIFIASVTEVSNTECARRVLQRFGHRTLPPQNASLILRCKGWLLLGVGNRLA